MVPGAGWTGPGAFCARPAAAASAIVRNKGLGRRRIRMSYSLPDLTRIGARALAGRGLASRMGELPHGKGT